MTPEPDVYPTGVLADLLAVGRCLDPTWPRRSGVHPARLPWRWQALTHRLRHLRGQVRHRAAWRGFYAEGPPGIGRVGTGWTRTRALRDLLRAQAEP